jgi:hypothetical protein
MKENKKHIKRTKRKQRTKRNNKKTKKIKRNNQRGRGLPTISAARRIQTRTAGRGADRQPRNWLFDKVRDFGNSISRNKEREREEQREEQREKEADARKRRARQREWGKARRKQTKVIAEGKKYDHDEFMMNYTPLVIDHLEKKMKTSDALKFMGIDSEFNPDIIKKDSETLEKYMKRIEDNFNPTDGYFKPYKGDYINKLMYMMICLRKAKNDCSIDEDMLKIFHPDIVTRYALERSLGREIPEIIDTNEPSYRGLISKPSDLLINNAKYISESIVRCRSNNKILVIPVSILPRAWISKTIFSFEPDKLGSHANILLFNYHTNKAEYYEPHGLPYENSLGDMNLAIDTISLNIKGILGNDSLKFELQWGEEVSISTDRIKDLFINETEGESKIRNILRNAGSQYQNREDIISEEYKNRYGSREGNIQSHLTFSSPELSKMNIENLKKRAKELGANTQEINEVFSEKEKVDMRGSLLRLIYSKSDKMENIIEGIKIKETGGYCMAFCFLYLENRFKNLGEHPKKTIERVVLHLRGDRMRIEQFIRGYTSEKYEEIQKMMIKLRIPRQDIVYILSSGFESNSTINEDGSIKHDHDVDIIDKYRQRVYNYLIGEWSKFTTSDGKVKKIFKQSKNLPIEILNEIEESKQKNINKYLFQSGLFVYLDTNNPRRGKDIDIRNMGEILENDGEKLEISDVMGNIYIRKVGEIGLLENDIEIEIFTKSKNIITSIRKLIAGNIKIPPIIDISHHRNQINTPTPLIYIRENLPFAGNDYNLLQELFDCLEQFVKYFSDEGSWIDKNNIIHKYESPGVWSETEMEKVGWEWIEPNRYSHAMRIATEHASMLGQVVDDQNIFKMYIDDEILEMIITYNYIIMEQESKKEESGEEYEKNYGEEEEIQNHSPVDLPDTDLYIGKLVVYTDRSGNEYESEILSIDPYGDITIGFEDKNGTYHTRSTIPSKIRS